MQNHLDLLYGLLPELKPCQFILTGIVMGSVDCWLCQTIHQIFGDSPADYPRRFVCVSRRGLSPLEARM